MEVASFQGESFSQAYQRSLMRVNSQQQQRSGELEPRYDQAAQQQPHYSSRSPVSLPLPEPQAHHPSHTPWSTLLPAPYPGQVYSSAQVAPLAQEQQEQQLTFSHHLQQQQQLPFSHHFQFGTDLPGSQKAVPFFPQATQNGFRGSSCRYTSWTGAERTNYADGLDCIEDEVEDEDEDLEAAAHLRKLTMGGKPMMPSAGKDSSGLANPFSWKELERSCRQLDQARIRIEELDLTHCDEDTDTPTDSKAMYNFRLESFPEETDVTEHRQSAGELGHMAPGSPSDSSRSGSNFTSSTVTTQSSFSSQSGLEDMKAVTPAPPPAKKPVVVAPRGPKEVKEQVRRAPAELQIPQQSLATSKKMTALLLAVKEKCGLLFTTKSKKTSHV